ncbi:winged helix-turn-helix transcriptional regulator [Niallia sp. XMNu-256]|uniref:helix-turn-helix transcriptional regulator n=1 Tax=Niallia sp. XMNu-256 TaxID=3082444 RepID=UPI0030D02E7C
MLLNTKSTKEQILSLLKVNGSMTILEMAHELEITEMAVRRHIQTLERDKLIRSEMKKQTMGRPSKVYQLAQQGEDYFPKKYKEFSLELLQGLKEAGQEQLLQEILVKNREKHYEQYKSEFEGKTFSEKLNQLEKMQEHDGYMPKLENQDGTIHFKELNCPLVEVAKEFPQICQAERESIERFLGAELTGITSMAEGHSCCHYTIQEKNN